MNKVVCIHPKWELEYCCKCPGYNEIVTVESVHQVGKYKYYFLVGFTDLMPPGVRIDFNTLLFRPVQDIGDQVETHIQELIKKEDLQTISV